MLQFREGSKAHLGWSWHGYPHPHIPHIFSVFFLLVLFTNVLPFTHLWLPRLILSLVSPSIFLRLLLYQYTHYYLSLITSADLGMGFPQPRISFCACSRTRSPLGDNVGRIQIQCWKDTNTKLERYKYNVGRMQHTQAPDIKGKCIVPVSSWTSP